MSQVSWYQLSKKEVAKTLKTNPKNGLSTEEVLSRQKEFGKNKLPQKKPFSKLRIFLRQFQSPLIYILLVSGVISLVIKEATDAVVIFGTVLVNSFIGYTQEKKACNTLSALKEVVKHPAKVIRNKNPQIVDSEDLVPGDVVVLSPGYKVPADTRIIENEGLHINEMALTGEWLASEKIFEKIPTTKVLADRDNMAYMGTVVESGKGKAIVTSVGVQTEIGKIAKTVRETLEEKTPYQKKIATFSKFISIAVLGLCSLIFIEGIISGIEFIEMFTTTIAIAIAAIPEGLPISITIILSIGTERILKKKGLVRKLSSAETLGSTSVICVDKTGTLTEGKMEVHDVVNPIQLFKNQKDKNDRLLSLKIGSIFSEAFLENPSENKTDWKFRGNPTDKALLKKGLEEKVVKIKESRGIKKISEISFNSIDKFAAIAVKEKEGSFLFLRGAPEKILQQCSFYEIRGKKKKITEENLKEIKKELNKIARKGLRVIATAYKTINNRKLEGSFQEKEIRKEINNLVFSGFITLKDPVRKDVKQAISTCQKSGIKIIIITGDHKLTAKNVAQEVGLKINKENILEGKDLDLISEKDLQKKLNKIKIYARVNPEHKSRIIQAWQDKGEVVAMTGDGINDAPALKKADIGLALGSGTEVAKEASDLILLNNNLSVIVDVIKEGRAILDNIRKSMTYLLSDGLTEFFLIGISIITKNPLPITAVQLLWVNLIEDGLPDIALAFEPKEKNLMKRKVSHKENLLTKEMKAIIVIIAVVGDILHVGLLFWLLNQGHNIEYIRTMIFACLSLDSLLYVFSCKSLRHNIWHTDLFNNKFLINSVLLGLFTLVLSIYNPFLKTLLKTIPLQASDWVLVIVLALIDLVMIEFIKWHFIVKKDYE